MGVEIALVLKGGLEEMVVTAAAVAATVAAT
jgi:hypothetical protein